MTHNARHRRRMELPTLFTSVPKLFRLHAAEIGNVFREILRHATVRKTVASAECKISIREVLISVRLSVRGEVAERLKAAVC